MKDYRLSEIKAGKVDLNDEKKDLGFFDDVYCWIDQINIEPRDMIELPCKQEVHIGGAETPMWQVIYRVDEICTKLFKSEAEADAFLAELNDNGKKGSGRTHRSADLPDMRMVRFRIMLRALYGQPHR